MFRKFYIILIFLILPLVGCKKNEATGSNGNYTVLLLNISGGTATLSFGGISKSATCVRKALNL